MITPRKLWGGLGNSMFQHAYIHAQMRRGEIPDIYIQDEKYFKEFKEEIRELYGQGVRPINKVSLHIRRGDYINNSFYTDLTLTDYYQRAIDMFPPDTEFLVFCADRQQGSDDENDMEWCKRKFTGKNFTFFQGRDAIEDFNAMAGCYAHIMANSSFSWWASYVGGGRTIAPKEWFADGVERITLPEEWERI